MNSVRHVAIIMDGNGRWAKQQNKPRTFGHLQGTENVRNIAIKANDMGIEVLTLYAFSTENWKRPQEEVDYLMSLPAVFINRFLDELMEKDIRIEMIGDMSRLPEKTARVLQRAIDTTSGNKHMVLCFALNYGSRQDIVNGINRYAEEYKNGTVTEKMTEDMFSSYLSTRNYPEIDLLIRTSLEYRLSNFLLWELSYSELLFVDKYWPDFSAEEFEKAVDIYKNRSRRFGGIK